MAIFMLVVSSCAPSSESFATSTYLFNFPAGKSLLLARTITLLHNRSVGRVEPSTKFGTAWPSSFPPLRHHRSFDEVEYVRGKGRYLNVLLGPIRRFLCRPIFLKRPNLNGTGKDKVALIVGMNVTTSYHPFLGVEDVDSFRQIMAVSRTIATTERYLCVENLPSAIRINTWGGDRIVDSVGWWFDVRRIEKIRRTNESAVVRKEAAFAHF